MTLESRALLRHINGWKPMKIGHLRGQHFDLQGKACLLVTTGMGVRRAGEAARLLVETRSLDMLILFGIAGAVEADLKIGDVVLVEAFRQLEKGSFRVPSPLTAWPEAARQAAAEVLQDRGKGVFSGTAITTGGSQVAAGLLSGMRHPVLEMETAGIARVAAEKSLPLLSLRAISDGPCAPLPFDPGEVLDENANLKLGKLIKLMIRRPQLIHQSGQMRRNSNLAAECGALALVAALSQAGFTLASERIND